MNLIKYFQRIGAPDINPAATEENIAAAEIRLGGRLPDPLRAWFREANGFNGEAEESMWRFKSLDRLQTVTKLFHVFDLAVTSHAHPTRTMSGNDYIIFCDALIYLPFYAVNIRPDSPYAGEVLCGLDCSGPDRMDAPLEIWTSTPNFQAFQEWLFGHPEDFLHAG